MLPDRAQPPNKIIDAGMGVGARVTEADEIGQPPVAEQNRKRRAAFFDPVRPVNGVVSFEPFRNRRVSSLRPKDGMH
jgi:hypothetical protein